MSNKDYFEEEIYQEEDKQAEDSTASNSNETGEYYQDGYSSNMPNDYFKFEQNSDKGKFFGLGIASMVLGIVSIICCCFLGAPVVLAVLALVFSIMRMCSKSDGFAIAGLVTGIIGLIFNTVMLVLMFGGSSEFDIYEWESMLENLEEAIRILKVR